MAKTDKVMMNHVSAAKKWLGKAETSLEHDNNIRSDLHIMLAEAELKRAREKMADSPVKFWQKYALPLVLSSLFLAAGGFFLLSEHNRPNEKLIVPPVTVTDKTASQENAIKEDRPEQMGLSVPIQPSAAENNIQQKEAAESQVRGEAPQINRQAVGQTEHEQSQTAKIPSKEMQQLMRTAKNTLQK